ncbi:ferritin-like domain-containing protein [Helicobacter turcicus]|uniref:Ferritin-like domain-containing protein n=1 Tax=Helicobacter turcicus TaxID=2867412 RepID=A0ABS7JMU5_9HELI|nr:ferritin-like domain-containing protein [Helicobacter turcicus]MBX7490717.1 ferritin-like domain-containing protein [Helicobacter turcicus]MBX7545674.1 ferritin-like domain-containing protein [Helicobacter turcicus]
MESKNLFLEIFSALNARNAQEKCQRVQEIWKSFKHFTLDYDSEILPLDIPTFAHFCQIVPPKKVPQGKYLKTDLNVAHLLHSIAHIEFSAIDLALDCAYRFRGLPTHYYQDWLEVAQEEVKHFLALENLLRSLGFKYGDFGVHTLLFDTMKNCNILLDRIALIPRGMEAVGLDVNPFLCAKVSSSTHKIKNELLRVLEMILNDEIHHVSKGNVWFNYVCNKEEIPQKARPSTYVEILKRYNFSFPKANAQFNAQARLQAGFTQEELMLLQNAAFASKNPK